MHHSCFCQPVFWVPPKSALHFFSVCPNFGPPAGQVDGCGPSNNTIFSPLHKMVLLIQSGAFQYEGARFDHHICKLWIQQCLCSQHHHNCQGLLPQKYSCYGSLLVSSHHSGKKFTFGRNAKDNCLRTSKWMVADASWFTMH